MEHITLEDLANLLMKDRKELFDLLLKSSFLRKGPPSYLIKEGMIFIPGGRNYLVRENPLHKLLPAMSVSDLQYETYTRVKEVCQLRLRGQLFLTDELVERALQSGNCELPKKAIYIPTKRFGEDELTTFVFGGEENAKRFGQFLYEGGLLWKVTHSCINTLRQDYIDSYTQPFPNQVLAGYLPLNWLFALSRRFFNRDTSSDDKYIPADMYDHHSNSFPFLGSEGFHITPISLLTTAMVSPAFHNFSTKDIMERYCRGTKF